MELSSQNTNFGIKTENYKVASSGITSMEKINIVDEYVDASEAPKIATRASI